MSYDSDPTLWLFGTPPNVCTTCYPVGKSPDPTIITVSGMKTGDAWTPGDPPPPNGSYILPASGPCAWALTSGPYSFSYSALTVGPFTISITGPHLVFQHVLSADCETYLVNQLTSPVGQKLYGGFAIAKPPQVDTPGNVPTIMDLVGIPAAARTAVSPRPMTGNLTVYVFSRNRDRSNIKVKISTP